PGAQHLTDPVVDLAEQHVQAQPRRHIGPGTHLRLPHAAFSHFTHRYASPEESCATRHTCQGPTNTTTIGPVWHRDDRVTACHEWAMLPRVEQQPPFGPRDGGAGRADRV